MLKPLRPKPRRMGGTTCPPNPAARRRKPNPSTAVHASMGFAKRSTLRTARYGAARPSALMRSPHHFHGVLDMAPLFGFFGIAVALAGQGIAGRMGDRLRAVLLEHLSRDHVDFGFGCHVILLMFRHPGPQRPILS